MIDETKGEHALKWFNGDHDIEPQSHNNTKIKTGSGGYQINLFLHTTGRAYKTYCKHKAFL